MYVVCKIINCYCDRDCFIHGRSNGIYQEKYACTVKTKVQREIFSLVFKSRSYIACYLFLDDSSKYYTYFIF